MKKRKLAIAVPFASLLFTVSAVILIVNHSQANSNPPLTQASVLAASGVTSYNYCVPKGQVGPTWTYPDGVHPVEHPADPVAVAGQQQIQTITQKMEQEETLIAREGSSNANQRVLNSYTNQYNSLVAQYDTCSPRSLSDLPN